MLRTRNDNNMVEELLENVQEAVKTEEEDDESAAGAGMVLDATAEFCRSLGDIPTYGQAGNREHHSEIMDFEKAELEAELEAEENAGAWSRVDVHSEKPPDLDPAAGGEGALGAEPRLGAGVAGALQLALSKGYLEKAGTQPAPKSQHLHLLAARNYSIEDKTYG
ncbi:U4/U6.U5 tri-snRNP-associated protein 1 [Operophtera brumata]|uniref:U4/U6.U5 tri-snRNP-associated protein 1 n=1 Tax=Operophtera brumata TaxID=104452 RepID=A0A0L7KVF1_OPEBR|nr:U4/U6.U5 tri-snRNP-associated protein 1 [Operophtera brumata]